MANMSGKKLIAAVLAACSVTGVLAACGGDSSTSSTATTTTATTTAATTKAADSAGTASTGSKVSYPISGSPKITYWVDLNPNVSAGSKSMNETALTKALIEATGVNVEYLHPAQGQAKEQFNLLIAGGDLPDIIENAWLSGAVYPGGPELAFKNKILEPINDKLDTMTPDYKAYLEANPEVAKMVRTDEGNYFGFPFIRGHENLMVFYGPMVRKDWITELNITAPETVSEWYEMLKAFKEKKAADYPLTTVDKDMGLFGFGFLVGAYNIGTGFYLDDAGEVQYGPVQPQYKEFLTEMSKWYKEGLIDVNFYTNDRKAAEANLTNNKSGAILGYAGSGIGVWEKNLKALDPNAGFQGVKYPVLNKGDTPMLGQKDTPFMNNYQVSAVTANSKNKEAAYAFLNYGYTEAGEMMYNFGVEGESYNMEGTYPKYAESISNPGEGKTMAQQLAQYARSPYNGPFVQRLEYYEQYMQMDVQKDAIDHWKISNNEKHQMPPVTPTQDEAKEYNNIETQMQAWLNEWVIGAIIGKNSLDEFDSKFVAEMKEIGVDRALEIQRAAYQRYQSR